MSDKWTNEQIDGIYKDADRLLAKFKPADQASEPGAWRYTDKETRGETFSNQPPDRVIDLEKYEVAPLYLAPHSESAFKAVVLDALTINWALKPEHETDARLAVADLIAAETAIALDPAVSSDAQALIDKGRASERERIAKMCETIPTEFMRKFSAVIRELGDE